MHAEIDKPKTIQLETIFSQEMLESLASRRGESEALKRIRRDAWKLFELLPLPHKKMEEWRRTDVTKIPFEQFKPGGTETIYCPNPPFPPKSLKETGSVISTCDGVLLDKKMKENLPDGVIVDSWHNAAQHHASLVEEILQNPLLKWEDGKFESMNAAFLNMGLLIYVPANTVVKMPVNHWINFSTAGYAWFPRVTIIMEPNSEFTYLETLNAPLMSNPLFVNGVTEIILKDNARLKFVRVQNLEDNAYYIESGRAKLWKDAQLYHMQANMGAGWAKSGIESRMVGTNSSAELDGIYFANQRQHVDQKTMQIHEAPYSYSNLKYKGVATDYAHTIYQGMIRAEKDAQKIDAYQNNNNLILADTAKADSIPGLEILTNDLACSHGATVSQIDPEQLYYLMTRGVNEEEAKHLLVTGFFEEIIDRIPNTTVQDMVRNIIEGKVLKELKGKNE